MKIQAIRILSIGLVLFFFNIYASPAKPAAWWQPAPVSALKDSLFLSLDLTPYYNHALITDSTDSSDKAGAQTLPLSAQGLPVSSKPVLIDGKPFLFGAFKPGILDNIAVARGACPIPATATLQESACPVRVKVPKYYYTRLYAVCVAEASPNLSQVLTVRLARYGGVNGDFFSDAKTVAPRWNERSGPANAKPLPVETSTALAGNLWLVELPLEACAMQAYLSAKHFADANKYGQAVVEDASKDWLELELTKDLAVGYFAYGAAGPPSAVHVLAMTLERSPVEMTVISDSVGNVFYENERPSFHVVFNNITSQTQRTALAWRSRDFYGKETKRVKAILIAPGTQTASVTAPWQKYGKYDLNIKLAQGSQALLEYQTTFVMLPPDTRKAGEDSPFGLWSWGGGHLTVPNNIEADLMRKAGARWTLGAQGYPSKKEFGVGTGTDIAIGCFYGNPPLNEKPEEVEAKAVEAMQQKGTQPKYWEVYWEDSLSSRHDLSIPPALFGQPPIPLTSEEETRFQAYWNRALAYCKLVRAQMPQAKLSLGALIPFTEEFLRRGFPKEYLDAISLEARGVWCDPERPPQLVDLHALYYIALMKKTYGYEHCKTVMIESLEHGTAVGYLSERDQSNYYVRDHLLGLAYGVDLFSCNAMVTDVADDYYYSIYGSVGLLTRAPEVSPKESFASYATLTRALDQAKYLGYLAAGSMSAYALKFQTPDGRFVYPVWVTMGERELSFAAPRGATAAVMDGMGNTRTLRADRAKLTIKATEAPQYLLTCLPLEAPQLGPPKYTEAPPKQAKLADALSNAKLWSVQSRQDCARTAQFVIAATRDQEHGMALSITPMCQPGNQLEPVYGWLERVKPLVLPIKKPAKIGLWVKGRADWGFVSFQLVDAKGELWSGGDGSYGHGLIRYEGWRWLEFDLPGDYRRPTRQQGHCMWSSEGGDGVVDFPLALKRINLEMRDAVVYVTDLTPLKETGICIKDLMVY